MEPVVIEVGAAGSAGSATGTTYPPVIAPYGTIYAGWVDYIGQSGATPTLVLKETLNGQARTLLTLAAQNTDRAVVPLTQGQDGAGANVASQYVAGIPVFGGRLTLEISNADPAAVAARVTLLVLE